MARCTLQTLVVENSDLEAVVAQTSFTSPLTVLREPDAGETHFSGPVLAGGEDVTDGGVTKSAHSNGTGHIYGPASVYPGTTLRGRLFVDGVEVN